MPKAKTAVIPRDAKYQIVDGQTFVRLREAAKLAGIHPVVLEMGKELLARIGGTGAAFALATPELQKNADDIAKVFKVGLRRLAKAMEPNKKIKVKAYRDTGRLVFWYAALIALAVLTAGAGRASAQTPVAVSSASGASFIASSDHATVVGGIAVVDHYDFTVIAQTQAGPIPAGAVAFTVGLGKPTPDATNTITVKPIAQLGALANGTYVATVAAVGPGGSTPSVQTDPFVRVGPPAGPGKPTVVQK